MIPALVLTALLQAPGEDPIPTSFAMYVQLFQPSLIITTNGLSASTVSASVELGAVISGHHGMTVGLGFAAVPASNGGSSTLAVTFNPTYRYFFTGLQAQAFSPFIEGAVYVSYASQNFGMTSTTSIPFGLGAAFGAEYLFVRNFGIVAEAGLRFSHQTLTTTFGASGDTNALVIGASVAISMHF